LGVSFSYISDWTLEEAASGGAEAVTLVSPDGQVTVSVLQDSPPPTISLEDYGRTMTQVLQLSLPELQAVASETRTLRNGTPAYYARFYAPAEHPQQGEMLVVIRGEGLEREALIVQASGPDAVYAMWWAGEVAVVFDTFEVRS
jgi:hypothetical protein